LYGCDCAGVADVPKSCVSPVVWQKALVGAATYPDRRRFSADAAVPFP